LIPNGSLSHLYLPSGALNVVSSEDASSSLILRNRLFASRKYLGVRYCADDFFYGSHRTIFTLDGLVPVTGINTDADFVALN